jgi:catalase
MANTVKDTAKTRKVAILGADGVDEGAVAAMSRLLIAAGAVPKVVGPRLGVLKGAGGGAVKVDFSLATVGSVFFDAVYVPGGPKSVAALAEDAAAFSSSRKRTSTVRPWPPRARGQSSCRIPARLIRRS